MTGRDREALTALVRSQPGGPLAGRWLAGELRHHLGDARSPVEVLRIATRWLFQVVGLPVSAVLVEGGTAEEVTAWPANNALASRLAPILPAPLQPGTALAKAITDKQSVQEPDVEEGYGLFRPSDVPSRVRSLAVVPLTALDAAVGALLLHSPKPAGVQPEVVAAVQEVAGVLALVVTDTRLRQVVSAMQSAQEAARLREELLAALSHDMQTPLAVLLGSIKALQAVDDLAPKHRAGLYEGMARRGAQLQRLVEQFLDYSRIEAGRPIEVRPAVTDVAAAIAKVERDIGWRRPLDLRVPDDLPPAYVDPDRLDQVLANLVSNALKFSPVGSPITVGARADDEVVEVTVEDRGRGMARDELEQAFLKFHRGPAAEDTPGTGLGLYVSRAVIEAQGGRLTAVSQVGRGSRFTVLLPRQPVPADE